MDPKLLQNILNKAVDNKKVFGLSYSIKKGDQQWEGASGDISNNQCYFIASTTKLFTSALILNLKSKGLLNLHDPISNFLSQEILNGLHVFKGNDYSKDITIEQLLAHTSGLPDYFQKKNSDGKSLEDEIINENDLSWSFIEAIERSKLLKPLFAPGTKKKAHYSDTNFQLLGKIIENISGESYSQNCQKIIIKHLKLSHTYLYTNNTDKTPKTLYYKKNKLDIPKAMSSFGPDGGIVSTSSEMLIFIEAFFSGAFFPKSYIKDLQKWNRIFFPMKSGIGIHLFKLPWIFNPFGSIPFFIGHSGLSGALAFYCPKENLFIAGTVNQVAHPDISFKLMIKLTQSFLKK